MSAPARDRIVVVLVRARNPSNIGAAARAMHDFGFTSLRVVNDYPVPFEAAKSAVDASSVLLAAQQPGSLAEAVADCSLVLGTTAVGERALQHPLYTPASALPLITTALNASPTARVALLFGSEKTGLSNEELSYCHALLTIPMNKPADAAGEARHLSMNLGQAVAVCLYSLAELELSHTAGQQPPAQGSDLDRMTALLQELLDVSRYSRRHPANARPANVRRLIRRLQLTQEDAAVWTGIWRQLLHALTSTADIPSHPQSTVDPSDEDGSSSSTPQL